MRQLVVVSGGFLGFHDWSGQFVIRWLKIGIKQVVLLCQAIDNYQNALLLNLAAALYILELRVEQTWL